MVAERMVFMWVMGEGCCFGRISGEAKRPYVLLSPLLMP